MPIFAVQKEGWLDNKSTWGVGPRLPDWLFWFQTFDNSLDGDATFQKDNGISYWSKVKWLWRNPFPSFLLFVIKKPYNAKYWGDNTIKDNDNAKAGWLFVTSNDLFQFEVIVPIGFQRCFLFNLGWNIRALVDPNVNPKPEEYEATYSFSIRISGFME